MAGFFTNLFDELGDRRRRLRKSLGDRGQALASFAVLAGLMLGSLGLYLRPWMIDVSAWGFAVPAVFVVGYLLIDWRRQATLSSSADADATATTYDWVARLFSLACALAGAAAFVIAFTSEPAPPQIEEWTPPESAVSVEISP
jgi:phosphoglycerol transferase MdoB-like AlkP superfamily enzyme